MIIYTRRIKPISNSQYKKLKQNKFKKERKPIECIDTKEIVTSYTQYLRTEHWRKARLQKLLLNPLCEKCDSCADLTIHHKTYKHLGQESLTELLTLCVDCHSKLHKELRIKRKLKKRKPTKRQKYLVGNKVKMLTPYRVKLMIDKNRINHKFIPIVKLGESTSKVELSNIEKETYQINSLKCKSLEGQLPTRNDSKRGSYLVFKN